MIPAGLADWVRRWNIPYAAVAELNALHQLEPVTPPAPVGVDESWVQSKVRLDSAKVGWLGRNNVGALADKTGRFVRYGLANDSERVNRVIKSGDLLGIYRLTVTPEMVGSVVGQFWSLECKRPGWRYTGTEREVAQLNWANLVTANGGRASFTTGKI